MSSGSPPTIPDEEDRIQSLHEYDILDTSPGDLYEGVVSLASRLCDTPMAAVSVVGEDHQWFPAKTGLDYRRADREHSFCAHAIADPETPLVVPDARQDPRFRENPAVTDEPEIRFYAGAPLRSADGNALGTLCVLDDEPRELDDDQRDALESLRDLVMAALESRRLAREAREANAALQRQSELLDRSMDLVTEKVRDQLSGVLSNLDLARLAGEDLDDETREHLESALASGEDIDDAIEDLLEFSEVGNGDLQPTTVGLRTLVADVETELEPLVQKRGARLEVEDPLRLHGDPDLLEALLTHLIENALRYGGDAPEIRVRGQDRDDEHRVLVHDDGPGVPDPHRDHVFELFRRGADVEDVPGRGVGLAVCRRIVERHGGTIGLESTPGAGSTFWFTLPKGDDTEPVV